MWFNVFVPFGCQCPQANTTAPSRASSNSNAKTNMGCLLDETRSSTSPGRGGGGVLGVPGPPPWNFEPPILFINERRTAYNTAAKSIHSALVNSRNNRGGRCVIALPHTASKVFWNSCLDDGGIIFGWSWSSFERLMLYFRLYSVP